LRCVASNLVTEVTRGFPRTLSAQETAKKSLRFDHRNLKTFQYLRACHARAIKCSLNLKRKSHEVREWFCRNFNVARASLDEVLQTTRVQEQIQAQIQLQIRAQILDRLVPELKTG
jgi:hypothetical protein